MWDININDISTPKNRNKNTCRKIWLMNRKSFNDEMIQKMRYWVYAKKTAAPKSKQVKRH